MTIPRCRNCRKCKVSKGLSCKKYWCRVKQEFVKDKQYCESFYPVTDNDFHASKWWRQ